MTASIGYAAQSARAALAPFSFERRQPGEHDIVIDAQFCGICHSDLHQIDNDWGRSRYPMVPGHEIVGRVVSVGRAVTRFKPGDHAGIGCMVDSCRHCAACAAGDEQFCEQGATMTYNGYERGTRLPTYGGYSSNYVVAERFALKLPENLDPAGAAPLLCAGITTYSPLKRWKVGPGQRVGVVGLGGLGHMAVKIARAMGATVVVFSSSPNKRDDALRLGAHELVVSSDAEQMKAQNARFDFILDTVSADHDFVAYLSLLRHNGTLCLVGLPNRPETILARNVIYGRRTLTGSLIGGIEETQETLDFCAKHHIVADIELLPVDRVNEAIERLRAGDVKYRFVLDLSGLRA